METVLIIALVLAAFVIGYLIKRPNNKLEDVTKEARLDALNKIAPEAKPEMLPGVRRENALQRYTPKANKEIFHTKSGNGRRVHHFDVEEGEKGKYLRISEVESLKGRETKGYTIMVFHHEIAGFQKALDASVKKINT